LVLLSLLGAGYSHLSKDEYDGEVVGPRIKKGIRWILLQQCDDGSFNSGHDDVFDQGLATLALGEAYGTTAAQTLKDPATHALDALVRLQGADGSWGGIEPTTWAVQALASADLGELP